MTCAMIESARSSFVYHEDGLKRLLPLKKYSWPGLCFTDGSAAGGGKPGSQPVKFCFYTQYCWILSVAFGLLRSYCLTCYCFFFIIHLLVCRIHDHWHHIVSKNPRWVMLFFKCKPVPKNYLFFFFGFVLFFVVFFFCSFCIVDNKIISPDFLDFYYMTTFCKHWSNHNI